MQYRAGTIHVTPGSPNVVGDGTKWLYVDNILTQIDSSHWVFKIKDEDDIYSISSITDDTHLTLGSNYGGSSELTTANYMIVLNYTSFGYLPMVTVGDQDWATILKFAIEKFETNLTGPTVNGTNTPRVRSIKFEARDNSPPSVDGTLYYDDTEGSRGIYFYDGGAATWRKIQDQLLIEYI